MISTRSLVFLDTTIASSLEVSFEHPVTTEGGAATLAETVAVTSSETIVVDSHSSSVADLDEEGANGSQKSQLEGGGGGGGGRAEEVTEVELSEHELKGGT